MNPRWIEALAQLAPWIQGLIGGLVITGCNTAGALAVLIWKNPSSRFLDTSLGFAAGVMLTASFTSLILPGIAVGGLLPVLVGLGLGALAMDAVDHRMPHTHAKLGHEGPVSYRMRGVWLFILAITLHNIPEGLAVGVAFGSGDPANALKLMLAIGIQNLPEGLAVAVAARRAGFGTAAFASVVGARSGLVELPMAVLGAWAVHLASPLLPYAMGFAAGAMLYIISDEIVPETHQQGHERAATWGTVLGASVMLTLDVALG